MTTSKDFALTVVLPAGTLVLPADRKERIGLALKAIDVSNKTQLQVLWVLGMVLNDAEKRKDLAFVPDLETAAKTKLCDRNLAYARQLNRCVDKDLLQELYEARVPWTWVRESLVLESKGETVLPDFLQKLAATEMTREKFDSELETAVRTTRLPDVDGPPPLPVDSPGTGATDSREKPTGEDSLLQWGTRVIKTMATQEKQVDDKVDDWSDAKRLLEDVPGECRETYCERMGDARDAVEAQIEKLQGLLACVVEGLTALEKFDSVP